MPFGFGLGIVNTSQLSDGAVTNAKVNASAAIVQSKLATLDHTLLSNIGTTTHADVDTHIAKDVRTSAAGPHGQFLSISMVQGG